MSIGQLGAVLGVITTIGIGGMAVQRYETGITDLYEHIQQTCWMRCINECRSACLAGGGSEFQCEEHCVPHCRRRCGSK